MTENNGTDARYSFGMSADEDGLLLQAVKTWREGETLREQRLSLGTYGAYEELAMDAAELDALRNQEGLGAAMHVAEALAVASGHLDRDQDDPRLFTEGPRDPFQTIREREIGPEGAAWFEAAFASGEKELLQPIDDTVNYAIVVQYADAYTVELAAEKYWRGESGRLNVESVTLSTYEPQPENENEVAAMDRELLLHVHASEGLDSMMQEAWEMAVEGEYLDVRDARLFREGPADRFVLRADLAAEWADLDDTQRIAPAPGPMDAGDGDRHRGPDLDL